MFSRQSRVVMIAVSVMLLGVVAYASSGLMIQSDNPITPKPDQALIVFMRLPASFGKAFLFDDYGQSVSLYELPGTENRLIGFLKGGTKICYEATPGEHLFMVAGEAADFMKAMVESGKIYYVLVTPRMGFWQARYSLRPLRQMNLTSAEFPHWDSETSLVEKTSASEEWAQKHAAEIENKRTRYWVVWSEKTKEQQDLQTLHLEDGR
ncbi:MAG TPA: hypothetical protein DDW50_16280 [Firmicutes bacterium]|jgi:hypothetical protein|nr:hypothetical protein [Bacillota bacterium]